MLLWLPDNGWLKRAWDTALLDYKTKTILHSENFPGFVLNAAEQTNKFAFLSDSERGSLVVFSLSQDRTWQVSHSAMRARVSGATFSFFNPLARLRRDDNNDDDNDFSLYLQNIRQQYQWISGISFLLGSRFPNTQEDISNSVKKVGRKPRQTDWLAMDKPGPGPLTVFPNL